MEELLISNARIVYPATTGFVMSRGWLLARDGIIAGLGAGEVPAEVVMPTTARQEIDAAGMTLLPGLLNTQILVMKKRGNYAYISHQATAVGQYNNTVGRPGLCMLQN